MLEGYFVVVAFPSLTGVASPAANGSHPVSEPLLSVSPNPSGPGEASIRFAAPAGRPVSIDVYDVAGRHVRNLVAAGKLAGSSVAWDGRDDAGRDAAPGIYFVRMVSGAASESKRISLVR